MIGGIAGDMFIAAMLDCDSQLNTPVLECIAAVLPHDIGHIKITKGVNKGISGLRVQLALNPEPNSSIKFGHTDFTSLVARIKASSLELCVQTIAIELLTILAKAEAKIHDKPLDKVHFHELADWDSLMDIVAIAAILHHLRDYHWEVSSIPIGRGRVKTEHGMLPIPAPATLELLHGFSFIDDGEQGERITPTGALILRYLKDKGLLSINDTQVKIQQSKYILQSIGYGLGEKTFATLPNILRVSHFCMADANTQDPQVAVIEFEIDDMTGEEIACALDNLRAQQGVFDVNAVSARGKKNRPLERIQLITDIAALDNIINQCFICTSTIGLRWQTMHRRCLKREHAHTDLGRIKTVLRPGNTPSKKIEHDDLDTSLSLDEQRKIKCQAELGELQVLDEAQVLGKVQALGESGHD